MAACLLVVKIKFEIVFSNKHLQHGQLGIKSTDSITAEKVVFPTSVKSIHRVSGTSTSTLFLTSMYFTYIYIYKDDGLYICGKCMQHGRIITTPKKMDMPGALSSCKILQLVCSFGGAMLLSEHRDIWVMYVGHFSIIA